MHPYPYYGPPTRKSRTGLFFALGAAGLTVTLVAVLLVVMSRQKREDASAAVPSQATSTSASAIAGEAAIIVKQLPGEGQAAKYGAIPVYDACSLLTVDGLAQIGMRLRPTSNLLHGHVDGDVPADVAVEQGATDSVSFCDYMLANNNRVYFHVHQTPYTSRKDLDFELGMPERQKATWRDENGLRIAVWEDTEFGGWSIRLTKPDLVVVGFVETEKSKRFGDLDAKSFTDKVTAFVADNLRKPPTAPMRHVYESPYMDVKPVCEIASVQVFTKGVPARSAALVEAHYYLSAARQSVREGAEETALQTVTSCRRTSVVREGGLNKQEFRHVQVNLSLWDDVAGADGSNQYRCDPAEVHPGKPPVVVDTTIGSGKPCMSNILSNWHLVFQADKVNVEVSTGFGDEPTTPDERRTVLMPIGQALAEALPR